MWFLNLTSVLQVASREGKGGRAAFAPVFSVVSMRDSVDRCMKIIVYAR